MKARIALKRLSRSERANAMEMMLETAAPAVVGAVLYILYRRGWHKDKIHTLYKEIVFFFSSPARFDKWLTNEEVQEYLTKHIGIDWDELINAIQVER